MSVVNSGRQSSNVAANSASFDLLRAKLEPEVPRPAVIAITSATVEDGKEVACLGLADALSAAGYSTLLLNTGTQNRKSRNGLTLDGIAAQLTLNPGVGKLAVFDLDDALVQKAVSQRQLQSALEIFRKSCDYVVINTEHGASTAFASSVIGSVDAVLVTVKTGRRQKAVDTQLSEALDDIGSRFLGVIALDPSIIEDRSSIERSTVRRADLVANQLI